MRIAKTRTPFGKPTKLPVRFCLEWWMVGKCFSRRLTKSWKWWSEGLYSKSYSSTSLATVPQYSTESMASTSAPCTCASRGRVSEETARVVIERRTQKEGESSHVLVSPFEGTPRVDVFDVDFDPVDAVLAEPAPLL